MECLRCSYKWEPNVVSPKQCPSCKSYDYNKERQWVQTNKSKESYVPSIKKSDEVREVKPKNNEVRFE